MNEQLSTKEWLKRHARRCSPDRNARAFQADQDRGYFDDLPNGTLVSYNSGLLVFATFGNDQLEALETTIESAVFKKDMSVYYGKIEEHLADY